MFIEKNPNAPLLRLNHSRAVSYFVSYLNIRSISAGNWLRTESTIPGSISAVIISSSSPASTITCPRGSTIMLWPAKGVPTLALVLAQLQEKRYARFSWALALLNNRQASTRARGQADTTKKNFAFLSTILRKSSGNRRS